jgi:ADP-heptose:LPS heptosyltransferase
VGDSVASAPASITVVRPGALGDTLLALPALALLRRWAPIARLTFVARDDCLPLALANGLADSALPWNLPDWSALFADAPNLTLLADQTLAQADVVIVWAADPDGQIARRLAHLGARRALVTPPQPPADTPLHVALWLAQTLRPLGAPAVSLAELASLTPALTAPAEATAQADAHWRRLWPAPQQTSERVIALHPGAGSPHKRWPAERFAALAARVSAAGATPLLLAGEADAEALRETQEALAPRGLTVALARDLPVTHLAALLRRCACYVGNDSGISHLAGLVGVPTVALFGPTDPARWSPLGPRVQALRAADARLASLSVDEVWLAMGRALAAVQAGG